MDRKRKTFAKILPQLHPDASAYAFTTEQVVNPQEEDRAVTREICDVLKRNPSFLGQSDGDWKYIDANKRHTYVRNLVDKNYVAFPEMFANMFRLDATYGLITPSYCDLEREQTKNKILADLDTCREFTSLANIELLLFDPSIGNPFGLALDNKVLVPDTPRHYYFAERIMRLLNNGHNAVVEIGGGYGGVVLMLRRLGFTDVYYIVDLFETCLIQYYFLKRSGVPAEIVERADHEIKDGNVYLIPTNISNAVLAQLKPQIVFSSRTFSDMCAETVEGYFDMIQKYLRPAFIYHETSNFLLFPNSERHIEVLGSDFPIDLSMYRLMQMSVSPFLGGGGRFREFLYQRR